MDGWMNRMLEEGLAPTPIIYSSTYSTRLYPVQFYYLHGGMGWEGVFPSPTREFVLDAGMSSNAAAAGKQSKSKALQQE